MTKAQFTRLTDVFWKTATVDQLRATFVHYASALNDLPPTALDAAISRWIREGSKMPFPKQLREFAHESIPRSERKTERADDRPCPHCPATIWPVRRADGRPGRFRLTHDADCPFPANGIQPGESWEDGTWERLAPAQHGPDTRDYIALVAAACERKP